MQAEYPDRLAPGSIPLWGGWIVNNATKMRQAIPGQDYLADERLEIEKRLYA